MVVCDFCNKPLNNGDKRENEILMYLIKYGASDVCPSCLEKIDRAVKETTDKIMLDARNERNHYMPVKEC